jgi:beta-galactosidase
VAVLLVAIAGFAADTANFTNHLNSEADVKGVAGRSLRITSEKSLSGGKCAMIDATECQYGKNPYARVEVPGKPQRGVLTFWVYSSSQEPELNRRSLYFRVGCEGEVEGKRKTIPIEMGFHTPSQDQWLFFKGGPNMLWRRSGVQFHPGWTRFDIINPGGDAPRNFIVCIDGREVARTPEKLLRIKDVVFQGEHKMFFDEVSYHEDPAAFRPAVVQDVHAATADKDGCLHLAAKEKLVVELPLARKGAKQRRGTVMLTLLSGTEKALEEKLVSVDWESRGDEPLRVELPSPARSGYYWLQAVYTEKGLDHPDVCRSRIDIQFLTPGYEKSDHSILRLSEYWDFIPTVTKMSQMKNPPDYITVPAAPPTDWSGAIKVKGPWFSQADRVLKRCNAGWYHRKLAIPKSFKGRRIWLDIDDPRTMAYIFVNGKNTGISVENPGATVDMTGHLQAGQVVDLDLFVVNSPYFGVTREGSSRRLKELLGKNFRRSWFRGWGTPAGLYGPLSLLATPTGARIDAVAVRPSVKDKQVAVVFELEDLAPGKTYALDGAVSAAGNVVRRLPQTSFTAHAKSQSVTVATTWDNPRLWEIDSPYLYDLNATLLDGDKQTSLDVMLPERFGVRDITLERLLKVNGTPINLFTDHGGSHRLDLEFGYVAGQRRNGYNFQQKCGYSYDGAKNARAYDEAGIGLRPTAAWINGGGASMLAKHGIQDDPEYWRLFESSARYAMKKLRNHPAVFFWVGPKALNYGKQYNPKLMDGTWRKSPGDNLTWQKEAAVYERCRSVLRSLDPSRSLDTIDALNDTIDVTSYAGFTPIQEAIEQGEDWIAYGRKPFFIEEQASPFQWDWLCAAGHNTKGTIPLIGENCAMTLGDAALVRDAVDNQALQEFEKLASRERETAAKIKDAKKRAAAIKKWSIGFGGASQALKVYSHYPTNKRNTVWSARLREQILNWRADGIGLFCGQFNDLGPEPLHNTLRECQQPVLGFLAGTPEKRTAKDHIFAPGETLVRSALILNNARQPVSVSCHWWLTLQGKTVAEQTQVVSVPAGGQVSVPIRVQIPAGGDRNGELAMRLESIAKDGDSPEASKAGETICEDRGEIEILAPRPFEASGAIAVVDPIGDSAKTLKKLGVEFHRLNFNANLNNYQTVVFGRNAFRYEEASIPGGIDLGALTRAGKNVVILEQDEQILRDRFKFRTVYMSPRDVFMRGVDHPLFAGLSNRTLRYWRGSATLTDGYAECLKQLNPRAGWGNGPWREVDGNDGAKHKHHMKWGNTHNLATMVILKPDTGNFRTLVDCEFALNYAATLELLNANGRIIFNQLDVTARTENDPAAERFLKNLLRYAETAPTPTWCRAVYLGGERGETLLRSLRLKVARIDSPEAASPSREVLILGETTPAKLSAWKVALERFVRAGGTIFSLPKDNAQLAAAWLPFALETKTELVNHSVASGFREPLLAGLGNADFYWQGNMEILAIKNVSAPAFRLDSGVLATVPHGQGHYVFCQVEPDIFDLQTRPWLKATRRYNERMLVTLLTNLHVDMSPPSFLAQPDAAFKLAATVDLAGQWSVFPSAELNDACPPATHPKWRMLNLPGSFQAQLPQLMKSKGQIWYRRSFDFQNTLPDGAQVKLLVGQISGADWIYLNGVKVGETTPSTDPNEVGVTFRDYNVPANALRQGTNEIAIRVFFDQNALLGMNNTTGSIVKPLLIEVHQPAGAAGAAFDMAKVDLVGVWKGLATKEKEALPPANDKRWADVRVPGWYDAPDAKGYPQEWKNHHGYFWYRKTFKFAAALPADAEPFLLIGGVDDEDTTYFNGTLIGHLGKDNHQGSGWTGSVPRRYPIPRELFKPGENVVTILDYDPVNSGGIWKPPVEIVFADPDMLVNRALLVTPYLHSLVEKDDPYRAAHY